MNRDERLKELIKNAKNENDGTHIDYVIPGYTSKRIISYFDMISDLRLIRKMVLRLLQGNSDDIVSRSFFYSIITLYGKCFTDATNTSTLKLEEKDVFGSEDKSLLEIHKEVMRLRHTVAAHRGNIQESIGMAYIEMYFESYKLQVKYKGEKKGLPTNDELTKYYSLINHVINVIERKIVASAQKVWKHFQNSFTPQEMAFLAFAGPPKEKIEEFLKEK